MKIAWIAAALLALSASLAEPANSVKVTLAWEHKDFAETVEVHELKGQPRLWETKNVKSPAQAPIGDKIGNSSFVLEPGQAKRLALVVKNGSAGPLFFFAAPHAVHPAEHSLGFRFKCLCINHAFSVGPGETWYRIVEFRLSKEFVGRELTVTHTIIGIDKARADAFSSKSVIPDF